MTASPNREMTTLPDRNASWTDSDVERLVGNWLRIGTIMSAAVTLLGGVLFFASHSSARADYRVFTSQPAQLRNVTDIVIGALHGQSRAVIQLGLLLLIATPIVRVALSLVAFVLRRDRAYMAITAVVLAILVFSLMFGGGHH